MTDAPKRIWAWETLNRNGQWSREEGGGVEYVIKEDYDALAIEWHDAMQGDTPTPTDPRVKARSDAIREFCEKAGLSDAVQVAGLPDDVRAYRRDSAVADMEARAALSALEENK